MLQIDIVPQYVQCSGKILLPLSFQYTLLQNLSVSQQMLSFVFCIIAAFLITFLTLFQWVIIISLSLVLPLKAGDVSYLSSYSQIPSIEVGLLTSSQS